MGRPVDAGYGGADDGAGMIGRKLAKVFMWQWLMAGSALLIVTGWNGRLQNVLIVAVCYCHAQCRALFPIAYPGRELEEEISHDP